VSFESDLYSHLKADATIAGLVGTRIYPMLLPQDTTKPAIVYVIVGASDQIDLDSDDGNLQEVRVQIDNWCASHADVVTLAEAVRKRMQSAAMTSTGGFKLGSHFENSGYDPETKLYRKMQEFSCWYRTT